MTEKELHEYIRENLRVVISRDYYGNGFTVDLKLYDGKYWETISSDYVNPSD